MINFSRLWRTKLISYRKLPQRWIAKFANGR